MATTPANQENSFGKSQNNPIPVSTVPASDLVFIATIKVGIVTQNSGLNSWMCLGSPPVRMAGRISALRIAAGIKSSHPASQVGSERREKRKRGNHRGI